MAGIRKTYYGVSIGILMVRTHFRRFPGDIGDGSAVQPLFSETFLRSDNDLRAARLLFLLDFSF